MTALLEVIFVAFCIVSFVPLSYCYPFLIIPGPGEKCNKNHTKFITYVESFEGSTGECIDVENSWYTPLSRQIDIVCEEIKLMGLLQYGYNIVGFSQGGLVARGVIELCDEGPPVKNFISVGAPQAGVSAAPDAFIRYICPGIKLKIFYGRVLSLCKSAIYSRFVQDHFAPSGYFKIPNRIDKYMKKSKFLPKLNNEIEGQRNSTYKERFSSLEKLVLIMFENERTFVPKESAWFGYYPDGGSSVVPPNKTKLYTEDWIGLKTLDEARKVHFVTLEGDHLEIDENTMRVIARFL